MSKLDELNIDVSILQPETPPRRAKQADLIRLPGHLRQDFSAEMMLWQRVLEQGTGAILLDSKAAAVSTRTRMYWARQKHRLLRGLEPEAMLFDGFVLTMERVTHKGTTMFGIRFIRAAQPIFVNSSGEEIS